MVHRRSASSRQRRLQSILCPKLSRVQLLMLRPLCTTLPLVENSSLAARTSTVSALAVASVLNVPIPADTNVFHCDALETIITANISAMADAPQFLPFSGSAQQLDFGDTCAHTVAESPPCLGNPYDGLPTLHFLQLSAYQLSFFPVAVITPIMLDTFINFLADNAPAIVSFRASIEDGSQRAQAFLGDDVLSDSDHCDFCLYDNYGYDNITDNIGDRCEAVALDDPSLYLVPFPLQAIDEACAQVETELTALLASLASRPLRELPLCTNFDRVSGTGISAEFFLSPLDSTQVTLDCRTCRGRLLRLKVASYDYVDSQPTFASASRQRTDRAPAQVQPRCDCGLKLTLIGTPPLGNGGVLDTICCRCHTTVHRHWTCVMCELLVCFACARE